MSSSRGPSQPRNRNHISFVSCVGGQVLYRCGHLGSPKTYTLPYVKWIASGNLLYNAGSSNPVLCDNLEMLHGVRGGRKVQDGGAVCIPMTSSC